MSSTTKNHFLDYLTEASQTVSSWPAWKKEGSDAARFQSENKKQNNSQQHPIPLAIKK